MFRLCITYPKVFFNFYLKRWLLFFKYVIRFNRFHQPSVNIRDNNNKIEYTSIEARTFSLKYQVGRKKRIGLSMLVDSKLSIQLIKYFTHILPNMFLVTTESFNIPTQLVLTIMYKMFHKSGSGHIINLKLTIFT